MKSMKLNLSAIILFAALGGEAAGQESEFAAGRAYYTEGEFKKAAAHFQLALKANPNDAESCYWTGMSYQVLADIAFPFSGKYISQARFYLTKATELAPGRLDYRKELFDFLLHSAGSSRAAARQAADLLRAVPEPDPEYNYMHQEFERESTANTAADARLGRLLLAVPRAAYRLTELPVARLHSRDGLSSAAGIRAAVAGMR